ncbi:MAG: glycosyltransferase [Lachnospiraceae bacterium]|nr:glycosyltransferase [Lachnospiraceae bacterium]
MAGLKPSEKLISVIVPVYNVEDYLKECVDSVLAQTHEKLELILVDDGSKDSSGKLCDGFAASDSRVKVIHKENGGLSSARNAGLEQCSGDYVFFLDSDDYIYEKAMEKMVTLAETEGCGIVVCGFCNQGEPLGAKQGDGKNRFYTGRQLIDIFYGPQHTPITLAWNKLYRRSVIGELRFPEGYIHEDEAMVVQFLYRAAKVGWIRENLHCYRSRSGSITGEKFSLKRLDILHAFRARLSFYESAGEEEYLVREEQCYLSALLEYYGRVKKELPEEKKAREELKQQYRERYRAARKGKWSAAKKLLYLACFFFPGLYSLLRRKGR